MPTLSRLIFIALAIGLLAYGSLWGVVLSVHPVTTELSVNIPQSEISLRPWP